MAHVPPSKPRLARIATILVAMAAAIAVTGAQEIEIDARLDEAAGVPVVTGRGDEGFIHRLEAAPDLVDWRPVFAAPGGEWSFTDGDAGAGRPRFYRGVATSSPPIAPHATWKPTVQFPDDPFLSDPLADQGFGTGATPVRWVKFTLLVDDLTRVVFQDSRAYPFHYNFAVARLDPFAGLTPEQFNAVTLRRAGQQAVLGAVLVAPEVGEFGIQFAGIDPYPREMVRFLFETVAAAIERPAGTSGFYLPTYEQGPSANADREYFEERGMPVGSIARWTSGNACYTEGWALGRLRHIPAADIEAAYLRGDLLPTDILLTEAVPAELPFVAGIVSLEPSTPNSHVAILSQSYGIPFVYLADEALAAEVLAMAAAGTDTILRVSGEPCEIRIIDATGMEPGFRAELLATKEPPPVEITPVAGFGAPAFDRARLDAAVRSDIQFVGGKASNFGLLRRTIPATSPEAIAFTFDLWAAYLAEPVPGAGRSLGQLIADRLAPHAWPPDLRALDADLAAIRDLVTDVADFPPDQKAAIIATLTAAGFDPMRKIRFRSSTNVEDTETFVGAGLYDSYSGCLADDTDGDDEGPSHCDPDEPRERGVFRAMRRVFASFYNRNAYLERLRRGVDESRVGMAILVHHSYPDAFEAANGVATARLTGGGSFTNLTTRMVSQVGAVSVTNPEGGALPEIADLYSYRSTFGSDTSVALRQPSNLIILGEGTVLGWESDYRAFNEMFFDVAVAYRDAISPPPADFTLEFEFKKLTDGSLEVKQVRQVPAGAAGAGGTPALVNQPAHFRVFQGEYGDVFANHRLKSAFALESDSRWLAGAGLESSILTLSQTARRDGDGSVRRDDRPLRERDDHRFAFADPGGGGQPELQESWTETFGGGGSIRLTLAFGLPWWFTQGDPASPVLVLEDFESRLDATFGSPQPYIDYDGSVKTRTMETVRLVPGIPGAPPQAGSTLQERRAGSRGIEFEIAFWWPPAPTGPVAGYTAPLEAWESTTLTGLTTEPIVLRDFYAQTYRPGHHNFWEEFLFEPAVDPALPASSRQELEAANVRAIYLFHDPGGGQTQVRLIGLDGKLRDP